jgi:catechol 2,3-dioxygenase-like lactoylglutathione lyase family enzyme
MQLDHVTLRTDDLETMKAFFTDVLGLRVGDRPPFKFPGYWLYGGDHPLVHLMSGDPGTSADTGAIDHVAFRGDDYDALIARLEGLGADFTARTQTGGGARQVFVKGPLGLVVEINFPVAA